MENNGQPQLGNGGSFAPHPQNQQQTAPVISVKEWLLTMLIMIIPIVNIIMMFVFAFGEGNPSKQNYFKAALIWAAIILGIYLVFFVLLFGIFFSAANSI